MTEIKSVPSLIIGLFRGKEGNAPGRRKNQGQVYKDLGLYTTGQQILITKFFFSSLLGSTWNVLPPAESHSPPTCSCQLQCYPI